LRPTTITIFLHDTIETKDLKKKMSPAEAQIKEIIARQWKSGYTGSEQESRPAAEVMR
jgi:hypothetical protein